MTMSIISKRGVYIPICDYCGDTLFDEYSFEDALEAMKSKNWRSVQTDYGWDKYCLLCKRDPWEE